MTGGLWLVVLLLVWCLPLVLDGLEHLAVFAVDWFDKYAES